MLGSAESEHHRLISLETIFEVFQPLWSRYLVTDGRTTCRGKTALCVTSRSKNERRCFAAIGGTILNQLFEELS